MLSTLEILNVPHVLSLLSFLQIASGRLRTLRENNLWILLDLLSFIQLE